MAGPPPIGGSTEAATLAAHTESEAEVALALKAEGNELLKEGRARAHTHCTLTHYSAH